MNKRFEYHYLQRNSGSGWETLGQSESSTVITKELVERLAGADQAEIRLVGARHDDGADEWTYHQLFYLDRSGISFDAGRDGTEGTGRRTTIPWDEAGISVAALLRDGQMLPEAHTEEAGAGEADSPALAGDGAPDEAEPPGGTGAAFDSDQAAQPEAEPAPWSPDARAARPVRAALPRRRAAWSVTVFYSGITLVLAGLIVLFAMLYMRHPLLADAVRAIGLESYVRLDPPSAPATATPTKSNQPAPPVIAPAIRVKGVDPSLIGRWSPDDCQTTYIEFSASGYRQTAGGVTAAEEIRITETQQDEFRYNLRQSPVMVEHFNKITDNDIKHVGTTTARGYHDQSSRMAIYSRCQLPPKTAG